MFHVGAFGHQSASLCRASQDYLDMTNEQSSGALYRPRYYQKRFISSYVHGH